MIDNVRFIIFSVLQISHFVSMARGSKMVRQCGVAIYWIKLHYSGDGTTEYTARQSRETFSGLRELHFYWRFRH